MSLNLTFPSFCVGPASSNFTQESQPNMRVESPLEKRKGTGEIPILNENHTAREEMPSPELLSGLFNRCAEWGSKSLVR